MTPMTTSIPPYLAAKPLSHSHDALYFNISVNFNVQGLSVYQWRHQVSFIGHEIYATIAAYVIGSKIPRQQKLYIS